MAEKKTREQLLEEENQRINDLIANGGKKPEGEQAALNTEGKPATQEALKPEEGKPPVAQQAQQAAQNTDQLGSDNWEHKFKVLDGKYRSEVPRLQTQIRQLAATNEEQKATILKLEGKVEALMQGKAPESGGKPASNEGGDDFLEREFGQELAEGVDKRIEKSMSKILERLDSVDQKASKVSEGDFYRSLDSMAAGWEQKNTDKGFLEFIRVNGPAGTDDTYQTLLSRAFEQKNVLRVAEIFNLYAGEGASAAQGQQQHQAAPNLDEQIVPGRSRGGESQTGSEAQKISRADIQAFYRKVQANPHRYTQEDITKFERKVERAIKSGNVIN